MMGFVILLVSGLVFFGFWHGLNGLMKIYGCDSWDELNKALDEELNEEIKTDNTIKASKQAVEMLEEFSKLSMFLNECACDNQTVSRKMIDSYYTKRDKIADFIEQNECRLIDGTTEVFYGICQVANKVIRNLEDEGLID